MQVGNRMCADGMENFVAMLTNGGSYWAALGRGDRLGSRQRR
jgi:hypothetical protein